MKEIQDFTQLRAEQHQEQNQKQEYKFIGSMLLIPGMKIFQFNLKTREVKETIINRKNTAVSLITGASAGNAKAQFNPDCIYLQALNLKNAKRKFQKQIS